MKKLILLIVVFFTIGITYAQQGINYKAVISDNGAVLQNQEVEVYFTILLNGNQSIYEETTKVFTDDNGIIILNIGEGEPTLGSFTDIDWSLAYYLNVQVNISDGNGLIDMGTNAFNAVPYAKYAENGGGATELGELDDARSDNLSLYLGNESGNIENVGGIGGTLGNTSVGHYALRYNTTGKENLALGTNSLVFNETGDFNVAVGRSSMWSNVLGTKNTALGYQTGSNSLGDGNIFLGYQAGLNETGSNKLYIENSNSATPLIGGNFSTDEVTINGTIAIVDGTQGSSKVLTSDANGKATWQTASSGATELNDLSDVRYINSSIFIGNNTGLNDNGLNNGNVGVGHSAMFNNTSGAYNTAIGHSVLSDNTSGAYNTAYGYTTMVKNTTGSNNTAYGSSSMYSNTTGSQNVAYGKLTLRTNLTGENNTAIGNASGYNATGSGNVFLGNRAGYNETGSNKLYIENSNSATPLIGGDFSTDEVTINGSLAIVDGTQGLYKVLTSDADGKATWQTASSSVTELNDLSDVIYEGGSIFIGNSAGINDNGANNTNIGIGGEAMLSNTTGYGNTAIGFASLKDNTTGSGNTANGFQALLSNISGSNNTAYGFKAGHNNLGTGNIFLGILAGSNETGSNKLYIENSNSATPLIGGDFSTDEVTINGDIEITGDVQGKVKAADSGDTDMKAYIYGSVQRNGANALNGAHSDGYTVSRSSDGYYSVDFMGSNAPTSSSQYTVMLSMHSGDIGFITVNNFSNSFTIRTYNTTGTLTDKNFNFVVYKK